MRTSLNYVLGPWVWRSGEEAGFYPPEGTVSCIDLRGDCTKVGFGLFITTATLGSDYTLLGTQLDAPVKPTLASKWASAVGAPTLIGATVLDCLVELLTVKADPESGVRCKGLLANHRGDLELYLLNTRVWSRKFGGLADPCWPNVQKVLQTDYAKVRTAALATGSRDTEAHRRLLTAWQRKYGVDPRLFIPLGVPFEAPLPTKSTITDEFNRAALGAGWTVVSGSWDIYGSTVLRSSATGTLRYDAASLSSDDHYSQINWEYASATARFMGPLVRFADAANTGYGGRACNATGTPRNIYKIEAGTWTSLWTDANGGPAPRLLKVSANADSISLYDGGVLAQTITDTAISGNLKVGVLGGNATTAHGDHFIAEDLVVTGNPWYYYLQQR